MITGLVGSEQGAFATLTAIARLEAKDLNEEIVEFCLSHNDAGIRYAMARNCIIRFPEISVNELQFRRGMAEERFDIRAIFALCCDYPMSEENAADLFAAMGPKIMDRYQEHYLSNLMRRPDFNPTVEQCDYLIDYNTRRPIWRRAICVAVNYKPNERQLNIGLSDPEPRIRELYASRVDFSPTKEQIMNAIKNDIEAVGAVFIGRDDCTFSPDELSKFLLGSSYRVKAAVAKRRDFLPTESQIKYGLGYNNKLEDASVEYEGLVSSIFKSRLEEWERTKERNGLNAVMENILPLNKNGCLTAKQIL